MADKASSSNGTVLITGANRGIGLALTQRFLRGGWAVVAACRNPDGARELWEIEHQNPGRMQLLALDVTDDATIAAARRQLGDAPIEILINNAGVYPDSDGAFAEVTPEAVRRAFDVNVVGTLQVTQAFLGNLRRGGRRIVANISSKMGSLADNTSGKSQAYRISKTALNMLTVGMARDLPDVIALTLHPGWVQTDMGGSAAPLKTEDSADGLFSVITSATTDSSGRFFDYEGQTLPW